MNNYFLSIEATQQPFPVGLDDKNRQVFSVNFTAMAAVPVSWMASLIKLLTDASLGVFGTDMYVGPGVVLPGADGPYVTIVDTGGASSERTHNSRYLRLSVQFLVTASDYVAGETRAAAISQLLDGKYNITVAT